MVMDSKLLLDQVDDPWTGPQVVRITCLQWPSQQNTHELLLLACAQAGLEARMPLGMQGLDSSFLEGGFPSGGRSLGNSQQPRRLGDALALCG
jgi:hypothetical protein